MRKYNEKTENGKRKTENFESFLCLDSAIRGLCGFSELGEISP
jgi:hypothetical protein